jgi:hypothetical protein
MTVLLEQSGRQNSAYTFSCQAFPTRSFDFAQDFASGGLPLLSFRETHPHRTLERANSAEHRLILADYWYVIPVAALEGRMYVTLHPAGCRAGTGMFERYREAWNLMG